MRKVWLTVAAAGAIVVPVLSQGARANTWTIDPGHSAARFSVKHMMISTVRGTLGKVTGTIGYDGTSIESISADVSIDISAINTENDSRDKDLKSDSFFDIAKYPTATFKSKRVQANGQGRFTMVGDLTMHGVTKELTMNVEGPSPALKQGPILRVGASATATVNRRNWNLQYNKMIEAAPIVGDEIQIQIDVEATRPG